MKNEKLIREPITKEVVEYLIKRISCDSSLRNKRRWKIAFLVLFISGCRAGKVV